MQEFLRLKKSNCRNCYKCIRHCPVKSIRFSGNQAHIVGDECVLCGNCFVICPQNAREIRNDVEKAKEYLAESSYPDGFECTMPTCGMFEKETQAVQYYLGQIGITVNLETMTISDY